MKKTINDANVRQLVATYAEFARVWRVAKDFVQSVDINLFNGTIDPDQKDMILSEKERLLERTKNLVSTMEEMGNSIIEEIGNSFDDQTRETVLLVEQYLESPTIKDFKAYCEADNSELEPNA